MTLLAAKNLVALLTSLQTYVEISRARQDAIGDEIRKVSAALYRVCGEPREITPTRHPLIQHLPAALALARIQVPEVAFVLEPIAALLPWRYSYPPRHDAPGLESAMGWAELVGPEAPVRSSEVCFGLTLIGPNSYYPPHCHPAIELYRVLAGSADWTAGVETATQPPGTYILHATNSVHAMRTGEEPLLAIYSWTGDVVSPSVWADSGRPSEGKKQ